MTNQVHERIEARRRQAEALERAYTDENLTSITGKIGVTRQFLRWGEADNVMEMLDTIANAATVAKHKIRVELEKN